MQSVCNKGTSCPFRHVKGDRTVVCKHWLRGLCKKGDDCEFLHEYDMSKMPGDIVSPLAISGCHDNHKLSICQAIFPQFLVFTQAERYKMC